MYFASSSALLNFFWQNLTRVCSYSYTARVLCISSNSQSFDLSKLPFALLCSGTSSKHLKYCRSIEFRAWHWNLQKLMKLITMHEISILNAMKYYINVLKNIYIIQVYQKPNAKWPKLGLNPDNHMLDLEKWPYKQWMFKWS